LFSCPSCLMPLPASCSPLPPAWLQMKGFWKYISVGRTEEDAGIEPRTVFAIMGVSTGVGGTQGGGGKGWGVDGGGQGAVKWQRQGVPVNIPKQAQGLQPTVPASASAPAPLFPVLAACAGCGAGLRLLEHRPYGARVCSVPGSG
jgi:hypothetical protein